MSGSVSSSSRPDVKSARATGKSNGSHRPPNKASASSSSSSSSRRRGSAAAAAAAAAGPASSLQSPSARVGQVRALKRMPNTEKAAETLISVVREVSHVLGSRGWNVGVVSEFFPKNPSLLGVNVNRGVEIKLRLRHAHDPSSFLEYHDVLGTMVHEMTHMKISKHDASFYKLMDELYDEVERRPGPFGAQASSYGGSNNGFIGESNRLGGKSSSSLSARAADEARAAAMRRAQASVLFAGSGQRLGGGDRLAGGSGRPLTPAELRERSLAAAERRLRDSWCHENDDGSTGEPEESRGATGSEEDDDYIISLVDDGVDDDTVAMKRQRQNGEYAPVIPLCMDCSDPSIVGAIIDLTDQGEELSNDQSTYAASISSSSSGTMPDHRSAAESKHAPLEATQFPNIWACRACTFENTLSDASLPRVCEMCNTLNA